MAGSLLAMLAAALLATSGAFGQIEGIVSDDESADSWAPSREEAVVSERRGSARQAQYQEESLPGGSPVANSRLMSRRPSNLSRPAPWTSTNFAADEQAAEPIPAPDGGAMPMSPRGLPVPSGMYAGNGPYYDDGGACGGCCNSCCGNWNSCGPAPICCCLPHLECSSFELFGGVQGYTNPANRGGGGSFGFHEGFNWGSSLCGCGAFQIGSNWTQSNLDGTFFTPDSRDQTFVTAGYFRRCDMGLQGGVVFDWLHEEWDYEVDLAQLRAEVSWKCCQDDFGAWVAIGTNGADVAMPTPIDVGDNTIRIVNRNTLWEVNDIYAFFWRRQFECGGEGRVFGGFTANGQGLLGANAIVPLNPCWSLRSGFLYVIPNDSGDNLVPDFVEETWNVSLSLVWTPFANPGAGCCQNYCRPLFNVADNGSFITRLTQ
jgi:hypothetical protein